MSRSFPLFIVDAFTDQPFGGNPAAVCLLESDDEISDELKQKMASEMNLSETVFLSKLDPRLDFRTGTTFGIRWFTPKNEVPLCGHATLAAAKVLAAICSNRNPTFNLESKFSGTLFASPRLDGLIILNFPKHVPKKIWHNRYDALVKAVVGDLPYVDIQFGFETRKLLVRLDDQVQMSEFKSLRPAYDEMTKLEDAMEGVCVTVKGSASNGCVNSQGQVYDFASRFFAPFVGVNEDPVCGSAHSILTPYWSEILGKSELNALQCSPRVGELKLSIREDGRVDIGGKARIVVKGTIEI